MEVVIVERTFPEPVSFEELQERENASAWCLEAHNVRFVQSFFSRDRRRMICVYEAPDAEAVRRANDSAQMPYDAVWSGMKHGPESST